MPKVVTTNRPNDEPREVSEQEATDLRFMGLLVEPKAATSKPAAKRAPRKAAAKAPAKAPAKPSGDNAGGTTSTGN